MPDTTRTFNPVADKVGRPISVTARSQPWVLGGSLAGTAGSNPTDAMDVCLLRVLCVVI